MILADYYLHYHWQNVPPEVLASKIWDETKENILKRQLENLIRRKEKAIKKAGQIGEEERKIVQGLLNPSKSEDNNLLKEISKITSVDYANFIKSNVNPDAHIQKFLELINIDIENLQGVEDFVEKLNNYLESLPELTQKLLDLYTQDVIERSRQKQRKGKLLQSTNLSSYTEIDDKILAALMGKYSIDALRIPKNSATNFATSIGKIKLVAKTLPNANLSNGMEVRHGNETSGKFLQDNELFKEIVNKCIAWLREADKSAREITEGKGLIDLKLKYLAPKLEKISKDTIIRTDLSGTKNFEVKVIEDEGIKEMRQMLGLATDKEWKRSKQDSLISISNEGVKIDINLGVNSKNYKDPISENLSSYRIKIQDETPLFTLLSREAGYSGTSGYNSEEIYHILQVASVVNEIDNFNDPINKLDYEEADKRWNKLMDSVRYRSLLNTLAGFEGSNDQSFYMNINGTFWTMEDFLNYFISSDSEILFSEIKRKDKEKSYGLIRSTYVNLNKQSYQVDDADGKELNGFQRSEAMWVKGLHTMYDTKIRVEINLQEISKLMQLVL